MAVVAAAVVVVTWWWFFEPSFLSCVRGLERGPGSRGNLHPRSWLENSTFLQKVEGWSVRSSVVPDLDS